MRKITPTMEAQLRPLKKTYQGGLRLVPGELDLYLRVIPVSRVIWTAPSGTVYTTKPGGSLFFPQLAVPTGQLVIPDASGPPAATRGLMMPTRTRTRAQDRAYRIALERQHNAARIARKHFLFPGRRAPRTATVLADLRRFSINLSRIPGFGMRLADSR